MDQTIIVQRGRAKINLMLDVGPRRTDGYHETNMIMQSLRLWDEITLKRSTHGEHSITCNIPFLKDPQKNIAYKALMLMSETYGIAEKVSIHVTKKIPIAAGLAGGSTDAAAVIRGMNRLFGLRLTQKEQMDLGAKLGSDVPFCVCGGTAFAYGRGELIKKITALPPTYVVLIKPRFSISTPWAYQQFDLIEDPPRLNCDQMIEAIGTREPARVASVMGNTLELPALKEYPVLGQLKEKLKELGAFASMMSGSGPTVFGLFLTREAASGACMQLKNDPLAGSMTVLCTETENPATDDISSWK